MDIVEQVEVQHLKIIENQYVVTIKESLEKSEMRETQTEPKVEMQTEQQS